MLTVSFSRWLYMFIVRSLLVLVTFMHFCVTPPTSVPLVATCSIVFMLFIYLCIRLSCSNRYLPMQRCIFANLETKIKWLECGLRSLKVEVTPLVTAVIFNPVKEL